MKPNDRKQEISLKKDIRLHQNSGICFYMHSYSCLLHFKVHNCHEKRSSEITSPFLLILKPPDKLIKGYLPWEHIVDTTNIPIVLLLEWSVNQYMALIQNHNLDSSFIVIRTAPLNITEAKMHTMAKVSKRYFNIFRNLLT